MGIKNIVKKVASKGADAVAKLSALSPEQLEQVQTKRDEYLSQMPNLTGKEAEEYTSRILAANAVEIYHAYLPQIKELYIPIEKEVEYDGDFRSLNNIRYINITKWVTDKKENSLEKLVNVYEVLSNESCNISLVFHRKVNKTLVYLAITNTDNDDNNVDVESYRRRLESAIKGNFPGSTWDPTVGRGNLPCFNTNVNYSVATASNVPTEKSEKFISQTIEKLLDGMIPTTVKEEYILVLLATPIQDISERKLNLSRIYSDLSPYASWQTNFNYTEADARGSSATVGVNLGASAGKSPSFGANFGANFARTSNVTATTGKVEGITQSFTNHNVKHALELLDQQMQRLEQSTALGMWDFAAYVLSEDQTIASNVAHSYLALTQGEESHMSQTVVNLWRGDVQEERGRAAELVDYLKDLRHPIFALNPNLLEDDDTFAVYPSTVTATTSLSGKELAYSLNFPQKSVAGLPVFECAEFGRNISSYEKMEGNTIKLGKIFHMNHIEQLPARISLESLASHTFITGSTGTGKSNTVYNILNEIRQKGIKFLVVEPAKGEYKHVFGNVPDVTVYGTNPELSELLRLNLFEFPKGIHVLEHIDRLVEIFNVCWPMYAAMPAVLKNAIEKAFQDSGWDLITSQNQYGNLYPTFEDVTRNIKMIIDSSEYDNENKGAYKGSLLTRLESLSNGINGLIFTSQAIPDKELFDENVIVDLSRVGSSETKSLIMGMLVLKLQEYRMSQATILNAPLHHVTVLEEAHNILKRTSSEQSLEGSNLIGKSVEMISNSIAEMRTYGEGFIIADQAPALLDMAAIRNTNTKIIMRLPDFSDRELVGKSANLNDDQIIELAKLPKGVAALYQNEWIEPILCKIEKFDGKVREYKYSKEISVPDDSRFRLAVIELLSQFENFDEAMQLKEVRDIVDSIQTDTLTKSRIIDWLTSQNKSLSMHDYAKISSSLYPELVQVVREKATKTSDSKILTQTLSDAISTHLPLWIEEQTKRDLIQATMIHFYIYELNDQKAFQDWAIKGGMA